jgi:histidine ammonia-lyase
MDRCAWTAVQAPTSRGWRERSREVLSDEVLSNRVPSDEVLSDGLLPDGTITAIAPDAPRAVVLDGRRMSVADVVALVDGEAPPALAPEAVRRVERSWRAAHEIAAAGGRIYGRSTGVGANRTLAVVPEDAEGHADGHGMRLLRSHAGAIGEPVPAREARAMLAVRLNQLLAGGAGLRPAVVAALAEALGGGAYPVVHEYGAVGTGDLAALAQTGLALVGEHPWGGGPAPAPIALGTGDALALISSNALTLGQSALALHELRGLLRATHAVAALSLLAVGGSLEPYAVPVHAARPHPGAVGCAAEIRRFLGAPDRPGTPAGPRVQDPYAFRCLPQIHGPALDAADALERVLEVEINAAAENPLITAGPPPTAEASPARDSGTPLLALVPEPPAGDRLAPANPPAAKGHDPAPAAHPGTPQGPDPQDPRDLEDPRAWHHGNFFAAHTALALDTLRLALLQTAQLSAARLAALADPALTGLRPFLADGASAGSGMMILEYAAAGALATLRTCATPASLGHAVLSRGVEEQASFASQGARLLARGIGAFRQVLACELVTAVRALRQRGLVPDPALPVGRAYAVAVAVLDADMTDRPLTGDVAAATGLLGGLGGL